MRRSNGIVWIVAIHSLLFFTHHSIFASCPSRLKVSPESFRKTHSGWSESYLRSSCSLLWYIDKGLALASEANTHLVQGLAALFALPVLSLPTAPVVPQTGYTQFTGDGSLAAGWPAKSAWVADFDTMFTANRGVMSSSCAHHNVGQAPNSPEETTAIHNAVVSIAASSGIDARFIFATLIQESSGCVRIQTTANAVRNPGLMQSHNGPNSCNINGIGTVPCPTSSITGMIADGTTGTGGLSNALATAGTSDASGVYRAARIYNSGSLDASGDLAWNAATPCYASDIANRLLGFVGDSPCTLN